MEGKCLLFKNFGDVNAIPLCIDARNADDIVAMAKMVAPTFGRSTSRTCRAPIPFRGGAPPDRAGHTRLLRRPARLGGGCAGRTDERPEAGGQGVPDTSTVIMGAGAAGISVARLLLHAGAGRVTVLNKCGIIGPGNGCMNFVQEELAKRLGETGRSLPGRGRKGSGHLHRPRRGGKSAPLTCAP